MAPLHQHILTPPFSTSTYFLHLPLSTSTYFLHLLLLATHPPSAHKRKIEKSKKSLSKKQEGNFSIYRPPNTFIAFAASSVIASVAAAASTWKNVTSSAASFSATAFLPALAI